MAYPSVTNLVSFLMHHKNEVNAHLDNIQVRSIKAAAENNESSKPAFSPSKESERCETCSKLGHTSKNCFRNLVCSRCKKKGGHSARFCRSSRCKFCGNMHRSSLCPLYPSENITMAPCSKCIILTGRKYYHSEKSCLVRPENQKD